MTVWLWLILLRNLASLKELSVGGSPPRTEMETVKKNKASVRKKIMRAFAKEEDSLGTKTARENRMQKGMEHRKELRTL